MKEQQVQCWNCHKMWFIYQLLKSMFGQLFCPNCGKVVTVPREED